MNDFKAWAFGKEPDEAVYYKDIPDLWNGKNVGLMKVNGSDTAIESFDKMLMLYEANVEKLQR